VGKCGIGPRWGPPIPRSGVPGMLRAMTLLWFVIWFVSNLIGGKEALTFDPVNWWAGTLILAAAIDLNKSYVIKHG